MAPNYSLGHLAVSYDREDSFADTVEQMQYVNFELNIYNFHLLRA